MNQIQKTFKNPGEDWRGAPFWSWNDKLEQAELRRQIREMKKAGMGGFFMHSRVGLITEYLSREWMKMIKACVDEAKKTGMNAWLYDEDRWPSGAAGGIVTSKNKKYRNKGIVFREKTITFEYAPDSPWYNGASYLDTMSKEAVDAFIKSTHEAYLKEAGGDFGKTIPGIFTDEPNYHHWASFTKVKPKEVKAVLPWTDKLPEHFNSRCNYSIIDKLPSLIYETGNFKKHRYNYWKCVTELFLKNFSENIYSWCEKHNLQQTGHYLAEQTLESQIRVIGAAMPHYMYMHQPGIDILCERISEIFTVKQCSSVANQLGRKRVLSELYGCTGWDFSFEGQKWVGDWQYALGVNFRCQHLSLYSLKGCRKRDYPASIHYQSPWWKYYKKVEDYYGRLSFILSQGKAIRDILVLHPIGSAWSVYHPKGTEALSKLDDEFLKLSKNLLEIHRDFDYGDEMVIEKYGKIKDGEFVIGKAGYKLVIIPYSITWNSNTFKLLRDFTAQGGKILTIGKLPNRIDGSLNNEINKFLDKDAIVIENDKHKIEKTLNKVLKKEVQISGEKKDDTKDIIYQLREIDGNKFLFLVNTNRKMGLDLTIKMKGKGVFEKWDSEAGDVCEIETTNTAGYAETQQHIYPTGSLLLSLNPEKKPKAVKRKKMETQKAAVSEDKWDIDLSHMNALTLDFCKYRIQDKEESRMLLPVWKAQEQIREHFGLPEIKSNSGVQFWKAYKNMKDLDNAKVSLKFEFLSNLDSANNINLLIEEPQNFDIFINNKKVMYKNPEWYIDISFKLIHIAKYLKNGKNEVLLVTKKYQQDVELENCYILGDFTVNKDNLVLEKAKDKLKTGNWVGQGFPFYPGSITYKQDMSVDKKKNRKYILKINKHKAAIINIKINNRQAGLLCWEPYELDITKLLKRGTNKISLELVGSLRNMLGPLHYKGKLKSVGPGHFCKEEKWTDKYKFVSYGIFGKVEILEYNKTGD
ncbi:MAG: glycosyl hydrolase [bacterium]|nr:glycosyl hydrolase [bacterium]